MANLAKLLVIQGGKCFYCGKKIALDDATVDHVIAKALGGDNSEGNTVACCHAINQAFGHATPKEKLLAVINGAGQLECPVKRSSGETAPSIPKPELSTAKTTHVGNHLPVPTLSPAALKQPIQAAFQVASASHGGEKAMLSAIGVELRKRVKDFNVKHYGEKTLGKLVTSLGYRIDKHWCLKDKA